MVTVVPEEVGVSSARLGRLSGVMQRFVDEGRLAGLVTLIARRGRIAHLQAYGMAERETGRPMRTDTIMRIYSMTKPITSVAALMLYEEGHFLLDDPLSRFIPGLRDVQVFMGKGETGVQLAPLEREITIRDLFTFTAGLGYGMNPDDPFDALYRDAKLMASSNLDELIQRLVTLPLASQPGRAWRYSVGIDVLGYLVQLISGMPFDAFLAQRLFEPLGMEDTGFAVPAGKMDSFAACYGAVEGGGLKQSDPLVFPFLSGGGGLVSTASDYWRFAEMLLNGGELDGVRVLGPKTVELMTTNHLPAEMLPFVPPTWAFRTGYGMGLGVRVIVNLAETGALGSVGVYGWSGAASTDFWVDPREELVGIFMPQLRPDDHRLYEQFRVLVYQALTD